MSDQPAEYAPHPMTYQVKRAVARPPLDGDFSHPAWAGANELSIDWFHPHSSRHRPVTRARVLYDDRGLYAQFLVHDCYVRSVRTAHGADVSNDSCVELFIRPTPAGYFNIEVNCGGTMHLSYIRNPTRGPNGFAEFDPIDKDDAGDIDVFHSAPRTIPLEITTLLTWRIAWFVPWALLERYAGPIRPSKAGKPTVWRANAYKCAVDCSHPHWASWSPVGEELNFHVPERFGMFNFIP